MPKRSCFQQVKDIGNNLISLVSEEILINFLDFVLGASATLARKINIARNVRRALRKMGGRTYIATSAQLVSSQV